MVGRHISVEWGGGAWYAGVIVAYTNGQHVVVYEDGETRSYSLSEKKVRLQILCTPTWHTASFIRITLSITRCFVPHAPDAFRPSCVHSFGPLPPLTPPLRPQFLVGDDDDIYPQREFPLGVGCRVSVMWSGGAWYDGDVVELESRTRCLLVYDDGDQREYEVIDGRHFRNTAGTVPFRVVSPTPEPPLTGMVERWAVDELCALYSPDKVIRLLNMGFDSAACKCALQRCGGQSDQAAEWLMEHSTPRRSAVDPLDSPDTKRMEDATEISADGDNDATIAVVPPLAPPLGNWRCDSMAQQVDLVRSGMVGMARERHLLCMDIDMLVDVSPEGVRRAGDGASHEEHYDEDSAGVRGSWPGPRHGRVLLDSQMADLVSSSAFTLVVALLGSLHHEDALQAVTRVVQENRMVLVHMLRTSSFQGVSSTARCIHPSFSSVRDMRALVGELVRSEALCGVGVSSQAQGAAGGASYGVSTELKEEKETKQTATVQALDAPRLTVTIVQTLVDEVAGQLAHHIASAGDDEGGGDYGVAGGPGKGERSEAGTPGYIPPPAQDESSPSLPSVLPSVWVLAVLAREMSMLVTTCGEHPGVHHACSIVLRPTMFELLVRAAYRSSGRLLLQVADLLADYTALYARAAGAGIVNRDDWVATFHLLDPLRVVYSRRLDVEETETDERTPGNDGNDRNDRNAARCTFAPSRYLRSIGSVLQSCYTVATPVGGGGTDSISPRVPLGVLGAPLGVLMSASGFKALCGAFNFGQQAFQDLWWMAVDRLSARQRASIAGACTALTRVPDLTRGEACEMIHGGCGFTIEELLCDEPDARQPEVRPTVRGGAGGGGCLPRMGRVLWLPSYTSAAAMRRQLCAWADAM